MGGEPGKSSFVVGASRWLRHASVFFGGGLVFLVGGSELGLLKIDGMDQIQWSLFGLALFSLGLSRILGRVRS